MVRNIVRSGINAFVSKQTNIFSAAFFIIVTTIFSQLLGVFKYRYLGSIFGASSDLGVFFASFRIPDFLFQVVIAGSISASFIPLFTEFLSKEKKEKAFSFASTLITISLIIFLIASLVIIIFAYPLSQLIAPGFSSSELTLMANLMRIIQLSQVFFILGTIATAILQSFQHFLIPGVATAFYNIGIILGLYFFASTFGIYGAVIGVLIGAFLFFAVQLPLLKRSGFMFFPSISSRDEIKQIIILMIPRSLTLIVSQIAITANVFFASFISARSLVIFDFAQTLVAAPILLFGQSIAQASFPALSLKSEDKKGFVDIFISSFNQIVFLTLPISVLLIVLRIPLVRLIFGASKFDWSATVDTGKTLAFLALSVFAQALIYLLSRAFYAIKDTKTPFFVTVVSVVFNIILLLILVLGVRETIIINNFIVKPIHFLAISYSLASVLSILLMLPLLNKKMSLPKKELMVSMVKIFSASFVMGIALYIPFKLLDKLVYDTTKTIDLLMLTGVTSTIGFVAYIFFTWLLDIKEAYYVIEVIKKFGNWKNMLKEVGELIDGPKLNP